MGTVLTHSLVGGIAVHSKGKFVEPIQALLEDGGLYLERSVGACHEGEGGSGRSQVQQGPIRVVGSGV